MRLWLCLVTCVVGALSAPSIAADPSLDHIHELLVEVRAHRDQSPRDFEGRGAVAQMTDIKHELRDWVETQLPKLKSADQLNALKDALNAALVAADLTETGPQSKPASQNDFFSDLTGSIPEITLELKHYGLRFVEPSNPASAQPYGLVIVRTSVGILCGSDESVYVYRWEGNRFHRILDDERAIGAEQPYAPQSIDAIDISFPDNKTGAMNVLVLGQETWCSSNWHQTFHRIWHINGSDGPAKLLIDQAAYSYFGNDPPIQGSISSHAALVEFRVGSLDDGVHSYETVRHYRFDEAGARRIAPIALGPRAFTEEWLKAEWQDASEWSEAHEVKKLRDWHQKLHADFLLGEFTDTGRCGKHTDTVQVGIEFTAQAHEINDKQLYVGTVYFTLRWQPPFEFQMIGVSTKPRPACRTMDQYADDDRTLFPVQDWVGWK